MTTVAYSVYENIDGKLTRVPQRPPRLWPNRQAVPDAIPERARHYLLQAIDGVSQPDASVVMSAAAVDAMLKNRQLTEGTLNTRIKTAKETHLITAEMAEWAHEVRLAANEQRHADVDTEPATPAEAQRLIDFALALGEFLFVLPARVERGRGREA